MRFSNAAASASGSALSLCRETERRATSARRDAGMNNLVVALGLLGELGHVHILLAAVVGHASFSFPSTLSLQVSSRRRIQNDSMLIRCYILYSPYFFIPISLTHLTICTDMNTVIPFLGVVSSCGPTEYEIS